MADRTLTITLDDRSLRAFDRRLRNVGKTADEYIGGLIREDERRAQDELAAEGYRLLSKDTGEFADAAWHLAQETWPEWEESVDATVKTPTGYGTCRDEVLATARDVMQATGKTEFRVQDVVAEMQSRETHYPVSTIRTHITSRLCRNAPQNHGSVYPDFERVGRGVYRFAQPEGASYGR